MTYDFLRAACGISKLPQCIYHSLNLPNNTTKSYLETKQAEILLSNIKNNLIAHTFQDFLYFPPPLQNMKTKTKASSRIAQQWPIAVDAICVVPRSTEVTVTSCELSREQLQSSAAASGSCKWCTTRQVLAAEAAIFGGRVSYQEKLKATIVR
jgi:hypothetical protein